VVCSAVWMYVHVGQSMLQVLYRCCNIGCAHFVLAADLLPGRGAAVCHILHMLTCINCGGSQSCLTGTRMCAMAVIVQSLTFSTAFHTACFRQGIELCGYCSKWKQR
jgi:hypothetical protein